MSHSSSSYRCGSCGGTHRSSTTTTTTYDHCAGGLKMTAQTREAACTCGSGKHYDKEDCPPFFAISCETKQALRDCAKEALCDFARCVTEALCPDGRYETATLRAANIKVGPQLVDCFGQLACSFLRCLPEALCEEGEAAPADCLPCDYAVEVVK